MADAWGGAFGVSWGDSWGAGVAPVETPDTHDGGPYSRREYDEIRRRIKRAEQAREQSDKQRRKAELRLKESVERAYRRIVEGLPDPVEQVPEIIAAAEVPTIASDGIVPFVPDFAALTQNLAAMSRLVAAMEERARDEDDIELLLLAL